MLNTNYVIRVLNVDEIKAMRVVVKDPNSKRTVYDHVAKGNMKTNFVSCTPDSKIAITKYARDKKGNVTGEYFAIFKKDLIKNKVYDFSKWEVRKEYLINGKTTINYSSLEKKRRAQFKADDYACSDYEYCIEGTPNEDSYVIVSYDELMKFIRDGEKYLHYTGMQITDLAGEHFFKKANLL